MKNLQDLTLDELLTIDGGYEADGGFWYDAAYFATHNARINYKIISTGVKTVAYLLP